MVMADSQRHINHSGFPLQIGLAYSINATHRDHGWRVLHEEHGWTNEQTLESGFIDLVVENQHATVVLNVECKRPQEATWQFLLPAPDEGVSDRAKFWATCMSSAGVSYFDWLDLDLRPASYESAFCVVAGQDSKSRPMLERVAASVVASTEALAQEEATILGHQDYEHLRAYINVIATTAKLEVCKFDPATVDLETGKIEQVEFEEVPYIRFRKQLSPRPKVLQSGSSWGFGALAAAKENTVLVVQASHFLDLLPQIHLGDRVGRIVSQNR
jgi:hypothetical protein